ncbi:MAG: L,D-transpeptidase [Polyangiaceae bacterium]|nr:L,D-transpeptidase [Polyangiaceae bacterium]
MGCERASDPPVARALSREVSSAAARTAAPSASTSPSSPPPPPAVRLDGTSGALGATLPGSPRVFARAMRAAIRDQPVKGGKKLGYLRLGGSAPLRGEGPAGTDGCPGGWYGIKPRGYVCVGLRATLDPNDPVVRATVEHPPDLLRKLPYMYGTVRKPGPIYQRLPNDDGIGKAEPELKERMEQWLAAGGEIGASYRQHVWLGAQGDPPDPRRAWEERRSDPLPALVTVDRDLPNPYRASRGDSLVIDRMKPRAGYSFLETFYWQGRRYGLTTDLRLMGTDRLRPIQGSEHHGVRIGPGGDIDFPFAIVRKTHAKYVQYDKRRGRVIEAGSAPYFTAVKLTGRREIFRGKLHYETTDGKYLSDREAAHIEPAKRMPAWGKNGEKWIDVNLTQQRLVLYEGTRPVYATLLSSGEAGLEDAEHTTATKRGIFRIHTKHVSATMDSTEVGEEFELRDVPYVQYFDVGGYALHGAYWHDRFGTPKSHGCLNLTPEDARRIFFWTEPVLPVGWHGVLMPLEGTVIFIHP